MSTVLRTLIVDDEPLALKLLASKLEKIPQITVIGQCKNGREAAQAIMEHEPDLVFLDIQMPGVSGLEVVKRTQEAIMPLVVFITAYEEYALEAFEANAVDYILKPLDNERLARAVARALDLHQAKEAVDSSNKANILQAIEHIDKSKNKKVTWSARDTLDADSAENAATLKKLVIKDRDEIHLIKHSDIAWIDAAGDYICVHANGQTYIKRSTLKEVLDELDDNVFKRIHRSTIVNLKAIEKVIPHTKGEFFLVMDGEHKIKVSRNYKDVIRSFLT
ncbi:DNA-binding response regulator [Alteromonas sediminis]|uniref:DNA-binding response regulator n=1 Tax=Alteromonas sediminis TaxID=2259342 RepID=A0A3N5XWP4_9ALTE|nr:LytTR family DNA-binding domain-containing protein [Alteromonas sediminis]RPJ65132.1 DNA-binding response regulator [Alteromonas sediminis]